jgi:hypothetical protein
MALALVASIATGLADPADGLAAPGKPDRVRERPVRSLAPDSDRVKETYVEVRSPLPASYGPHPKVCDWVGYLRFRNADGPRASSEADAVYVMIPGFIGGAASFDQLARHTVQSAAKRGMDVEFWALDRRANCLEDDTGIEAARKARDGTVGYDYYWNGQPGDGKTFPGWVSHEEARWLDHVGLARTMRDWYAVLKAGIPSRRQRARKVICGGHSLGGPLTAAFAGWDFDNDPKTKRDAGYRQCAAFIGLDTRLALDIFDSGPSADPAALFFQGMSASDSPYVDTPPLTPETFQLPGVFGVGTYFDPQRTDLLAELPHSGNIDLAIRLLYSRDAVHFATQMPSIRDFTVTNETVLAGVLDDNSQPLTFLRTSVGSVTGGPLVDKNFPSPDPTLALPEDPENPLYSWQNYDEVGGKGNPPPLNDEGEPYTSRESEVSDLRQVARGMFDARANYIEQYFPTRLLRDVQDAGDGDRSGDLSHLRYDGIAKRPAMLVNAGDSDTNENPDGGRAKRRKRPNDHRLSRHFSIPGYNHVDVIAAARRQNDGRPEPSAAALADFGAAVLKP